MTRRFKILLLLFLQEVKSYVVTLSSLVQSLKREDYKKMSIQFHPKVSFSRIHYSSRLHAAVSPDDFLQFQTLAYSFHDMILSTTSQSQSIDASFHDTSIINAVSTLLADAAMTSAEGVPPTEQSWWDNYIDFVSSSISFVHSTIDQPLRNRGFDQSWGLAIFLFTAGVRSLLIPLSIQQVQSTEYIKALKPYQDEIKAKFKGNKDMINRATAKLFEDAKANPLAGCLVSILQLPIFLGLYRGVNLLAKDGNLNEPFLFIPSLQGPVSPPDFTGLDWLTSGWHTGVNGLPEPGLGWSATLAYLIMPIVLVIGQAFTMSVLTPPPDENASQVEKEQFEKTQGILKFLPLLIGYFSLTVPAGLTIYWFTSNLFTLLQSVSVRGYYQTNPPKVELPDYWNSLENSESMSPEEKREAAKAGLSVGPKMEDMLDEARYHVFIERKPLRENGEAWQRALKNGKPIPAEMLSWINDEIDHDQPIIKADMKKMEVDDSLKEMPITP